MHAPLRAKRISQPGYHWHERARKTTKSQNFVSAVDAMEELFNMDVWRPAFARFWGKRNLPQPRTDEFSKIWRE